MVALASSGWVWALVVEAEAMGTPSDDQGERGCKEGERGCKGELVEE